MTRGRLRLLVVVAGVLLLALPSLAQRTPSLVPVLSILYLLLIGVLLVAGYRIVSAAAGKWAAAIVVLLGALLPIVVTGVRVPPEVGLWFPCPRNWGWLPTWQLRPSPMRSASAVVGGSRIKICYGSPALRGRRMIGGKQVPYGKLWRTGANEPTTIITPIALNVGGIVIPPGRASLYTIPGPETWEIIVNQSVSQWGIESEYTEALVATELGHLILPADSLPAPVERLHFALEPEAGGNSDRTDLILTWQQSRVRIPITAAAR